MKAYREMGTPLHSMKAGKLPRKQIQRSQRRDSLRSCTPQPVLSTSLSFTRKVIQDLLGAELAQVQADVILNFGADALRDGIQNGSIDPVIRREIQFIRVLSIREFRDVFSDAFYRPPSALEVQVMLLPA